MAKKLSYKEEDFLTLTDTDDPRISHVFDSKDGQVHANLFWEPGNVHVRGLVGLTGSFEIAFPFLNPVGDPRTAQPIIQAIINRLSRGEYDDQ